MEVDDAARVIESKKIRRLPVIYSDKRMIGMLNLGEVCHAGTWEPDRRGDAGCFSASLAGDDAEDYAVPSMQLAVAAVDEAERGTVETAVSRMDADATQS